MGWVPLTLDGKQIHLYKAQSNPNFGGKTILVDDPWDYVSLWLRRRHAKKAIFYWEQARAFYQASKQLPKSASPLTTYYSALNAIKALLLAKNVPFSEGHGVGGTRAAPAKTSLANERIHLLGAGVIPEFCHYLGESAAGTEYTLKDILYNLPYIHRAYTVTFREQELFIPISHAIFIRKENSNKGCFRCTIRDRRFQSLHTLNTMAGFEPHVEPEAEGKLIRMRKRFDWERGGSRAANRSNLAKYHADVRKRTVYIKGISRLWYIKRTRGKRLINHCPMTLTVLALHRLSELARYTPDQLARHFECQHNYLLFQFIDRALDQFIDEISAELTGADFMLPGYVGD